MLLRHHIPDNERPLLVAGMGAGEEGKPSF
jgi:hypothetical protein